MSHVPYCPNGLSYRPRIEFGDTNPAYANPPHESGESDRKCGSSDSVSGLDQPRTRRFTDGSYRSRTITGGRRTSFGSSQQYKAGQKSTHREPLDREASGLKVERLLKLRKWKLKEADRNGDEMELFRLKNLNILDDIERPIDDEDRKESGIHEVELLSKCDLDGKIAPPRSINQGHTVGLCWYMRLQSAYGVQVPTEFTRCTTHRAPDQPPTLSSSKRFTLNFTSPTCKRSPTISSPARSRSSSVGSTTLYGTDASPLDSPTSKAPSDEFLSAKQPQLKFEPEEEDPFLYIGKYIHHHTKSQKPSTSQNSSAPFNHSNPPNCTCSTHTCRDYLAGKPSKHCPTCKLPSPQPEILAAMSRIRETKTSQAFAQGAGIWADNSDEVEVKQQEVSESEGSKEDVMLVEMYDAEMEKRCGEGVWWEGWLVVEELKGREIVGSRS